MSPQKFPNTPFKFIWVQLKPFRKYCTGFLIIGLLWAIDLSLRPYLIKIMLDRLEYQASDLVQYLLAPAIIYISLSFFMNVVMRCADYLAVKLFPEFITSIVMYCIKYTQEHSHAYFQNQFGGSVVSRITELADSCSEIVDKSLNRVYSHVLAIIAACVALAQANRDLSYILLTWIIIFLTVSYRLAKRAHQISYEVSEANTTLKGRLIDSVTNMLAVRIFTRKVFEYGYIANQANKKKQKVQALWLSNLKQKAFMETASNFLIATILIFLIYKRQLKQVTIGDFTLSITISLAIINSIWNIAEDFLDFSKNLGIIKQTLQLIAKPHDIVDAPDAKILNVNDATIEFRHLTFSYNQSVEPLFNDLSLTIASQQKVGLVGYSGSGKTTFANLLIRLYDVQSGQILIDNQDIKSVTQDSLHHNITYIPQEPLLFHRSVMENIRYGYPEATDEQVYQAAREAYAHDFIQSLDGGYNSLVGERGVKLSGGQRQRIAIARAIIKNSRIIVLDEATSALDSLTESYIQQSLKTLMHNKTVFVIAHRLSTILEMDRILVFDKGKIIQDGSPHILMSTPGLFNQLLNMQGGRSDTAINS